MLSLLYFASDFVRSFAIFQVYKHVPKDPALLRKESDCFDTNSFFQLLLCAVLGQLFTEAECLLNTILHTSIRILEKDKITGLNDFSLCLVQVYFCLYYSKTLLKVIRKLYLFLFKLSLFDAELCFTFRFYVYFWKFEVLNLLVFLVF